MKRFICAIFTVLLLSGPAIAEIVSHPAGCPRRLFCGCGAALEVFGEHRRDLWLASAWFRFPRAEPGSGRVAVRRSHVFVLRSHVSGSNWIVYDANSGGGKTRVHVRSIAGYAIVDPHGSRAETTARKR